MKMPATRFEGFEEVSKLLEAYSQTILNSDS